MSAWRIPLSDLDYGEDEEQAALRILRSKWLSMGPEVETFEHEAAELLGVHYAFAVANGTAALHLALLGLGIGPGQEVVQPAVNFVAAANMTVAVGATPVFADVIGVEEPTIDPASIEACITPRTRAVVVMHYGGHLCRMADILQMCRRHGIALIEDACHALGARYDDASRRTPHGVMAGAIGDVACLSFFSNKNLATGEGGMVVTNRDDVAQRLRLLRSHGMTTLTWDRYRGHARTYDVALSGFNYRLDELHAALGRVQLRKLGHNNQIRKELVAIYCSGLAGIAGWVVPFAQACGTGAHHLMTVVAPDAASRQRVIEALRDARIQTSLHYPCVPDFTAFKHLPRRALRQSHAYCSRTVTLPLYPGLAAESVAEICSVIHAAVPQPAVL
jgi:dTDP-4-amino-4,6-dideoxygalactose transaminase